jgi:hypothetical protein
VQSILAKADVMKLGYALLPILFFVPVVSSG